MAFSPFASPATLFTVLAFWVFPVLLPICGLHRPRKGSDACRTQLPLFRCCPPSVWRSSPVHHRAEDCTLPRPGSIRGTWSRCSSRCA
ncbi:MAG: hypothetical protein ACLUFT_09920 [Gemmiger formicilis]|uniref:hypothetical protein n=1 Tax=Gemmiger formicilis TaxID=745368 RepID=UPI0039952074